MSVHLHIKWVWWIGFNKKAILKWCLSFHLSMMSWKNSKKMLFLAPLTLNCSFGRVDLINTIKWKSLKAFFIHVRDASLKVFLLLDEIDIHLFYISSKEIILVFDFIKVWYLQFIKTEISSGLKLKRKKNTIWKFETFAENYIFYLNLARIKYIMQSENKYSSIYY